MTRITRTMTIMLAGAALPLLAGCGANEIASPGTGGDVIINPPAGGTPTPTPTPPTGGGTVVAAAACPTIANTQPLTNSGTISSSPTAEWRVCTLPSIFSRSTTLPKVAGVLYRLEGRVDVGCDGGYNVPTSGTPFTSSTLGCSAANGFALNGNQLVADTNVTLTIEPGVVLYASTGQSWLAVNRGNKLNAVGTEAQPIVFTSQQNVLGQNNDSSFQQWGGVVLLGRGIITDCNTGSAGSCERTTEGAQDPAVFGGNDPTYNAGSMKYVQIRYSGFVIGNNSELQALTTEGVGNRTTLDFIQSHNSSDDGVEFFGGTVRAKHFVVTGADDDSVDSDTGADTEMQYVLVVQRPGRGDSIMEIDNTNNEANTPRQKFKLANFTVIQNLANSTNESSNQASILLRGNSDTHFMNGIVISPNNECIRMNGTGAAGERTTLVANSVVMQCNSTKYLGTGSGVNVFTAADVATAFGSGTSNNNDAYTPSLTSLFINGATETAVAAFDARTVSTFFDTTTYIGAVKDANDNWYKSWTCNSSYAPFDSTTTAGRACTAIPTI